MAVFMMSDKNRASRLCYRPGKKAIAASILVFIQVLIRFQGSQSSSKLHNKLSLLALS